MKWKIGIVSILGLILLFVVGCNRNSQQTASAADTQVELLENSQLSKLEEEENSSADGEYNVPIEEEDIGDEEDFDEINQNDENNSGEAKDNDEKNDDEEDDDEEDDGGDYELEEDQDIW